MTVSQGSGVTSGGSQWDALREAGPLVLGFPASAEILLPPLSYVGLTSRRLSSDQRTEDQRDFSLLQNPAAGEPQ